MKEYQTMEHTFDPVFDEKSKVLILGTFPSVKSREQNFYYGHPRNRFWQIIAILTGEKKPETIEEKKMILLKHGIAIWDVIAKCDIVGSSDSSIKNVEPADLQRILQVNPDIRIFANGTKSGELYRKYQQEKTGKEITVLPSTSPANAAYSIDRLMESWKIISLSLSD
jgi:hypoxanthine-DNA glycosylase